MKKLNTLFKVAMVAVMAMFSVNANAQHRGGREMHFGNGGVRMEHHMDGGRYDAPRHHGGYDTRAYDHRGHYTPEPPHHHAVAPCPPPRFDRYGYLPGWEGRVRYLNGRYGYLRGNDWYWYDTYYAPDYYYAHPVAHFHAHRLSPEGRAIVGAVAGTVAVAALIGALTH